MIKCYFVQQRSVAFDREDNCRVEKTQFQVKSNFNPGKNRLIKHFQKELIV